MKASRCAANLCVLGKMARNGIHESPTTALIFAAHASHMALIGATLNQRSQHALFQHGSMTVGHSLGLAEHRNQVGREHQIAQPQLRGQCLGEGADIDHATIAINRLQRIDWALSITKFSVIVVLHDPGVLAPRPLQ